MNLAGRTVGRGAFEPGWRRLSTVEPIVETDSCEVSHLGCCLQGRMKMYMDDGSEAEVGPGDAVAIPPGHDAEVVGEESCVLLEFGEFGDYAKRA